ncbi:hypothetical protein GH714_019947 [Hevea brasiliensis]|uniref:Malectin-like domain-containing protein n=1 Tax=Hevea brasiliensis TaxID=3981 RepID=A0A6A6LN80_HEVBR|nr:hypothetical protein GH714_019947 [Hevea brasiliensis]
MTSSKENYEALLDGLLWCCRPKTLSVALENERNRELVKFLCKAFTKGKDSFRRSSHCNFSRWRHHLKDAKIEGLEVFDERGLESLLSFDGYKLVTFELTWEAEDKGFLSIDCGTVEGYIDDKTGIAYVPDGQYISSGENHDIAEDFLSGISQQLSNVRSFPLEARIVTT